jgi:glyoxylase-like metal-dependent hydrolase (beta-lactamase superfamily II)
MIKKTYFTASILAGGILHIFGRFFMSRTLLIACSSTLFLIIFLFTEQSLAQQTQQSTNAVVVTSQYQSEVLSKDIFLIRSPSGNTLVLKDRDGLILVEGVSTDQADSYLQFLTELTGLSYVKMLFNTHWHDHSSGLNSAVRKQGGHVFAHANTEQWLGATIRQRGQNIVHLPVPEEDLPNKIFRDFATIDWQHGTIELGYLLQAHTDGDFYVRLREQNVIFTGPVMRQNDWANVDALSNGFIGSLTDAQLKLLSLQNADTVIVPASGRVMNQVEFRAQNESYLAIKEQMVALLRQSKSAQEVIEINPTSGMGAEWGDPSDFLEQGFISFFGHLRETRHVGVMP